jgi:hypothetical protein
MSGMQRTFRNRGSLPWWYWRQLANRHARNAVDDYPYIAESLALFARFTTPPTTTRKRQIDTLIAALKTAGVWAKLDALYVLAAADEQAAQRNWKQNLYNLTPVAAPAFAADRGYTGNGISSYLNTSFVPSTAAGLFTLNGASFGLWSRTNISSSAVDMGTRNAAAVAQTLLTCRSTSTLTARISQSANTGSLTNADGSGHFVVRRAAAATTAAFRSGVSLGGLTPASDALSQYAFAIGAINTANTFSGFSTRQFAAAHIGANLSDAEVLAFYNALLVYMQAVGAA